MVFTIMSSDYTHNGSLIFSFWRATLDAVEILLAREKVRFLRIDGSHTLEQRTAVIEQFQSMPEIKVLLLTLGTGSVG